MTTGKFDPSLRHGFQIASLFNVAFEDVFIYGQRILCKHLSSDSKLLWFRVWFRVHGKGNQRDFARNEAARAQKSLIEPEHLLVGLLADPTTTVISFAERSCQ